MVNHRDELARQIRNALAEQNDPDVPVVVLVQRLRTALAASEGREAKLREIIESSGEWLQNSRGKLLFHFGDGWVVDDETLALLSAPQPGEPNDFTKER